MQFYTLFIWEGPGAFEIKGTISTLNYKQKLSCVWHGEFGNQMSKTNTARDGFAEAVTSLYNLKLSPFPCYCQLQKKKKKRKTWHHVVSLTKLNYLQLERVLPSAMSDGFTVHVPAAARWLQSVWNKWTGLAVWCKYTANTGTLIHVRKATFCYIYIYRNRRLKLMSLR